MADLIRKLGKRPVQGHRYALVPRMKTYLAPVLVPPDQCDYTTGVDSWPMMKNDEVGDCTCAAAGHMIQEWTADTGQAFVPSDNDVLNLYAAVTGWNPLDPASDQGANPIDILNYWQATGMAGHKILGYVSIDPTRIIEAQAGIYLFGALYLGVMLPVSAQGQDAWDVPDGGLTGDGAPGSWGGHAIPVMQYDTEGLTCITWGQKLRMSWAFFEAYCDECYAVLSTDWIARTGLAPNNFDIGQLQVDLAKV